MPCQRITGTFLTEKEHPHQTTIETARRQAYAEVSRRMIEAYWKRRKTLPATRYVFIVAKWDAKTP